MTTDAIAKDIAKKEYAESPIGQAEKSIRHCYDSLVLKGHSLSDIQLKDINEIRKECEKSVMAYEQNTVEVYKTLKDKWAKDVDDILLMSFTKELALFKEWNLLPPQTN